MKRTWKLAIPTAIAVATLSCAQPASEEPTAEEPQPSAEAAPGGEQLDATVVDPDHYKVEFENDRVRIVRITYGPGEESVMHYHPDHVAVFLTDLHAEFRSPDGVTESVHAEAGTHMFVPAGQHHPRSTGDQRFEAVAIEVKPAGPGQAPAAAEAGPDPTVVDPGHYQVESENDSVRIVRIKYGPGEESVMHHHPDSVAVFLTDHHVEFQFPDRRTEPAHAKPGEHVFAPAGQHLPKNIGEEPMELVLVELK